MKHWVSINNFDYQSHIDRDNSKNSNTSNFPLILQYLTFRAPLIEMIILSIFIHRIEFSEKRDAETEKKSAFPP